MWATVLEKYTRVEGNAGQKKISSKLLASETPAKIKVSSKNGVGGSKKGPVKADHKISGVKQAIEVNIVYCPFSVMGGNNFYVKMSFKILGYSQSLGGQKRVVL